MPRGHSAAVGVVVHRSLAICVLPFDTPFTLLAVSETPFTLLTDTDSCALAIVTIAAGSKAATQKHDAIMPAVFIPCGSSIRHHIAQSHTYRATLPLHGSWHAGYCCRLSSWSSSKNEMLGISPARPACCPSAKFPHTVIVMRHVENITDLKFT